MFVLDPRINADTYLIGDLPLCRVLLNKDGNYRWLVLVPRRHDVQEVFQLDDADRAQLWLETNAVAEALNTLFAADKMNIANLGNVVAQLHVHVIVRYRDDPAWPAPVWGKVSAIEYEASVLADVLARIRTVLGESLLAVEG